MTDGATISWINDEVALSIVDIINKISDSQTQMLNELLESNEILQVISKHGIIDCMSYINDNDKSHALDKVAPSAHSFTHLPTVVDLDFSFIPFQDWGRCDGRSFELRLLVSGSTSLSNTAPKNVLIFPEVGSSRAGAGISQWFINTTASRAQSSNEHISHFPGIIISQETPESPLSNPSIINQAPEEAEEPEVALVEVRSLDKVLEERRKKAIESGNYVEVSSTNESDSDSDGSSDISDI